VVFHRAQVLQVYWRDNYICPSVEEYLEMAKTGKNRVRCISRFSLDLCKCNNIRKVCCVLERVKFMLTFFGLRSLRWIILMTSVRVCHHESTEKM
jgi:hypothetical protein